MRNLVLVIVLALVATGCSPSGSSSAPPPGGSASSGAGSTSTPGPLLAKAIHFQTALEARHLPEDLLVAALGLDPAGNITSLDSIGDSCIWTGILCGTEALRFKTTGDAGALRNVERLLRALHDLQAVTGDPGYVARFVCTSGLWGGGVPGTGAYAGSRWIDSTSRDQYSGLMFGYALSWDVIVDPTLRATVQADVRAIAQRLIRDDLCMQVVRNGQTEVHFELNPSPSLRGQLTPQLWATIDDFPLSVICQAVPYDPQLAAALENVRWPAVRAGEGLHALAFLKTAATITGDAAIADYYRRDLVQRRGYPGLIREYGTIFDDLLHGKDLYKLDTILRDLDASIAQAIQAYYQQKLGVWSVAAAWLAQQVLDAVMMRVADGIQAAIRFLNDPQRQGSALARAADLVVVAQVLDLLGEHKTADDLRRLATQVSSAASIDLDEVADSFRSYVGGNITHLSAYTLLSQETDPAIRAAIGGSLDREGEYIADEGNAFFAIVESAQGATGPHAAAIAAAKASLAAYPTDLMDRAVDHSNDPGLRVLPYPDRLSQYGNLAATPFPVDQRPPHHFVWQQYPREIRGGSARPRQIAHLGYLAAYWMGRFHGFIRADE